VLLGVQLANWTQLPFDAAVVQVTIGMNRGEALMMTENGTIYRYSENTGAVVDIKFPFKVSSIENRVHILV
jgi:hypothetical protein